MYRSANYPTSDGAADRFVAEALHGTLVACAPGANPQVTILPFVKEGDIIEVHCVQEDETFKVVRESQRVTFLVSDFLTWTPHDWVDEDNASRATLHFRAVAYEGTADVSTDPRDVAAALTRLLGRYEPGGSYRPLDDFDFYGSRLARLAVVRIAVERAHAKFKVGPYGPPELRSEVASRLRRRDDPGDERAAEVIERYLSEGT